MEANIVDTLQARSLSPEQPWGIFDSPLASYNDTFRHVLPEGKFENLVQYKSIGGKSVYAMDLYGGSGKVLRDLAQLRFPINGGVNVTLSDLRNKEQRRFDDEHSLYLVDGDVYHEETWTRVNGRMEQLGMTGFDIMLVRPEHGWLINGVTPAPEAVVLLTRQFWTMLSSYEGSLFLQLPPHYTVEKFNDYFAAINRWIRYLKEGGVDVSLNVWADAVIRINRAQADPEHLPELGVSS